MATIQRNALVAPFSVRDKITQKSGHLETTHQKWFVEAQQAINGSAQVIGNIPANSAAPGQPGTIAFDANFLYVCVGVNIWLRAPLSVF